MISLFRLGCDVAWSNNRYISYLVEPVAVFGADIKFFATVMFVLTKLALLLYPGRDIGLPVAGFNDSIEPLTVLL